MHRGARNRWGLVLGLSLFGVPAGALATIGPPPGAPGGAGPVRDTRMVPISEAEFERDISRSRGVSIETVRRDELRREVYPSGGITDGAASDEGSGADAGGEP